MLHELDTLNQRIDERASSYNQNRAFWTEFLRCARWFRMKTQNFAEQNEIENLHQQSQSHLAFDSDLTEKAEKSSR
jgi:hypothetical protein